MLPWVYGGQMGEREDPVGDAVKRGTSAGVRAEEAHLRAGRAKQHAHDARERAALAHDRSAEAHEQLAAMKGAIGDVRAEREQRAKAADQAAAAANDREPKG